MTLWRYQANLNKGELDPKLEGRIDTDLYYNGLKQARNVRLTPQGGVEKRSGTKYITSVGQHSTIRSFSFNNETEYLLLFTFDDPNDARMYVYKDDVLQTNINGSGNDYLVINTGSQWRANTIIDTLYMIQSANTALVFADGERPALIGRTSDTQWTFSFVTFSNVPQYDFNDASSPTPVDEVQSLVFANVNTGDRYKLTVDNFVTEEIVYAATGPENASRIEDALQDLANTGNSGVSCAFVSGSTYTVTFGGDSADSYGTISALAVLTQSTTFSGDSTVTTPGVSRKESAFGTSRGWPRAAIWHQDRLWLASTESLPDALFASVVGDYFNFNQNKARDDEAIFVVLQTDQVNDIKSLVSSRKLQVFTSGAEFYCPEDVITPSNVRFEVATNFGSGNVRPVVVDGSIIFPQFNSRALLQIEIANQFQSIGKRNIGVTAPHLLDGISRLALSRGSADTDSNYVYCLNSSGQVASLNYLPEEGVEGFSLWTTSDDTITDIETLNDKLYWVVNRNGTYMLEVEDANMPVDSGVSISASQTVDVSHINGETVECLGDGTYLGEFTASASTDVGRVVTSGQIGIAFRPVVETMPINIELSNGSDIGRKKRIRRAIIKLYESNGVTVNGKNLMDKTMGGGVFSAPVPRTAMDRVPLRGYGLNKTITVTQYTPYPFTLLSIGAEVKT